MKSFSAFLFLLFSTTTLVAQQKLHLTNDCDTAFWYRYKNKYAQQFKLGLIENDTTEYSFRFWSDGLVIKISGEANNLLGEITRFAEAYPDKKKTFTRRYPIPSSTAMRMRYLTDSLQIEALPSDKNIKGWSPGFDGTTYFTEYKRGNRYSFKNYWTPSAFDTLKEAIRFQSFISALQKLLNLEKNEKEFQRDIPFKSWTYPGARWVRVRPKPAMKKKKKVE